MLSIKNLHRRTVAWATGGLATAAVASAAALTMGLAPASASTTTTHIMDNGPFSFQLVPSPGIAQNCLPHARGEATIIPLGQNDLMRVTIHGMPRNAGFDLFVIQTPNAPFGLSWYQSDIQADRNGNGSVIVKGIFDSETFSEQNGTAIHQLHLGLWFNDPQTPFKLGCEPGATIAKVTPFNGEQNAGIQVLNTANFPDNAGPLGHVHR